MAEDIEGDELARSGDQASTWRRDLAIVIGVVLVFVAVVWVALDALPGDDPGPSADVSDLERFDEIELGELAGAHVQFGVTRSELLPALVEEDGRGETSLAIVDAGGPVIDAGPIPGEGWLVEGFPRASDRYVAMLTNWCDAEPIEGDTGLECGRDVATVQGQLTVYDIERERWSTTMLDGSLVGAVQGHLDGWGWKASGAGWEGGTTWTGTIDGSPTTETIANAGERRFEGGRGVPGDRVVPASAAGAARPAPHGLRLLSGEAYGSERTQSAMRAAKRSGSSRWRKWVPPS